MARQLYVFFSGRNYKLLKHLSSWNPPNHSHWRPDDWAIFFFGRNYAPAKRLYLFLFSGRNYHSYRWPYNCTFFFQVIIMNPLKYLSSWNPPNRSHWRPDDWAFFFRRIYEPAKRLYLYFFQVVIIIPTNGHRWLDLFFSGRYYKSAKISKLKEPPNHSHWCPARQLSPFFSWT